MGFPSQHPRDSITGPVIYCCAAGHSNAQRSIPTTIFISQDLESRIWKGLRWVLLAVCTALTEVTRWYSAGLVMPGALAGVDGRLDTAEDAHQGVYPCPLKSSGVSKVRLHGGSGSRRPRWKLPLLSQAKPGTGISPRLLSHWWSKQSHASPRAKGRMLKHSCPSLIHSNQQNQSCILRQT